MKSIDIIIPVYNAVDDVTRCIDSVLRHSPMHCRIVLIDDCSPDERIAALFAALPAQTDARIMLLNNASNMGFVGTVNRGMSLSKNDVVLLNSDTIVTSGWLAKLQRCADSDQRIGTITPFSNNAEICSFPVFCQNNPLEGLDIEAVNRALEEAALPTYPEIPTAVGFCMYIRRELLDAIGLFDAETFGLGYGEENDFCMRAINAGYRNVLCDDTFIAHVGSRSFDAKTEALKTNNMQRLLEKHPTYLHLVRRFIADDPIAPIRARNLRAQQLWGGEDMNTRLVDSEFLAPIGAVARTTAAIVVLFRNNANSSAQIAQLRNTVKHTVVVDNSSAGHPILVGLTPAADLTVLRNANRGGLAGAYNLARSHLLSALPEIRQIVLLDEDSDASGLGRLLADPAVAALLEHNNTAAVAPAYRDRATGLRGRHIRLKRFRLRYLPRQFDAIETVAFVINSMSVWRVDALRTIGPFNEGLAVDHVDTEYCLRARHAGLAVYLAGLHEFAHSIGQRERFTLFGCVMQTGGHSPARRYWIGRNTAWLARRHFWREPAFALLCGSRLVYEGIGIIMAESMRLAKLAALLKGALVGFFTWRVK